MTRTRGDSLVLSIAAHSSGNGSQPLPELLDDSYLMEKLQELSTQLDSTEDTKEPEEIPKAPAVDPYTKYTNYSKKLGSHIEEYESILRQSHKVNDQLEDAIKMFEDISLSVNRFVDNTKDTHDEYSRLSQLHEQIPQYLAYFDALDPIMRRLNHASTPNVVRKNSFKSMLVNIDESLGFFESHTDLKDAESYRIKFKRCLVRACELIANYLNNLLKQLYVDINEKLASNTSGSSASREALLYNKFASSAEEYQSQVVEIISRVTDDKHHRYYEELKSLLNDCYECYFQTRTKLLHSSIWNRLDEVILRDKELSLVNFIQDGKMYFQQLCYDEYQLFVKFFPEDVSKIRINQWFVQLCEPLYDTVRIRVLRETDISTLCDSLTLFGQYYEFEEDAEEYQRQFGQIKYDKVFEPIVQRLQATLILRVQNYVQNQIVKYTPTKDSFIIANRKSARKDLTTAKEKEDPMVLAFVESFQDQANDNTVESHENVLESYYPPLVRGLALLSRIYEMVNSVIFDDLAHHIVQDCMLSLKTAYNKVQSSTSDLNNFEVKLAYLRNLLMLRQQLQNFNIQYSVNETYLDFSGVESFFKSVTEGARTLRFRDSSVLSLARGLVPKVVNNLVDARTELMTHFRNIIKDFTEAAAKNIIEDTLVIDSKEDLSSLVEKNARLRQNVEDKLPRIHAQICNFINDEVIVAHLMDAVQETVIQSYSSFHEEVNEKAEKGLLDKEQASELMYEDVFADFLSKVSGKLPNANKE
ncbi:ZYRO0B11220p [Zygosaccharomyces rouxii]|uniref:Conserved oligomeric Golgi complex subunit 3 n=1 Tax=Zygosaccharomyces rouxii (strain ATCC 2623 / CBS 732 / NBRC 1130 / NCYC 568 / NRRL Y-229) TaxID=559307 RepID=C5DRT7_ZYGRC|nr:uncharacterized protein ZYRO0B11220g [Zygosaccharomyces rouxii]KAH9199969.1 Sec34-like family-domain-containing protein [Zygosaccharomyces rouxii]CAR26498.1 ZYRO0B11220p [Zygosaccharomyces rouxii]